MHNKANSPETEAIAANDPGQQVKTSKAKYKPVIILLTACIVVLASMVYSMVSWKQNQSLKSDIQEHKTSIASLTKEIASLKDASEEVEDAGPKNENDDDIVEEPSTASTSITSLAGEAIGTESGSIKVDGYRKTTAQEAENYAYTEQDPLLEVTITLTNTTNTAQTYDYRQFTFIDSYKIVQNNRNDLFIVWQAGHPKVLATATVAPGGSIQTKVFLGKYDSKETKLRWVNALEQEILVTIPSE